MDDKFYKSVFIYQGKKFTNYTLVGDDRKPDWLTFIEKNFPEDYRKIEFYYRFKFYISGRLERDRDFSNRNIRYGILDEYSDRKQSFSPLPDFKFEDHGIVDKKDT